jgi:hypothetical protein
VVGSWAVAAGAGEDKKPAGEKKPAYGKATGEAKIMPEAWKTAPKQPLTPEELDQLLDRALKADKIAPSPRTTDEQFIRRVTIDLTGKLPVPADVEEFAASGDPQKRAKLIDKLLASDDFARHWARYWHDVIISRATDMRVRRTDGALEEWLTEKFKANKSWANIARDMIMAQGELSYDGTSTNGGMLFLLAHSGPDAANERAAETSRVFLGIQIQCAQCHDHPSDIWKRTQFHELAAFYARTRERLRPQQRQIELVSLPRGEHQMPDKDDPKKTTPVHPRFLTGESIKPGQDDLTRRKALADFITSKDNYWFAAALPNRVWGELIGQGFYQPVDNMGPLQEATYPDVLMWLAASFRATDYDIKALFRLILNTQAYQRQIRIGDTANEHLHFAAAYPTRLRADSLWESLVGVLGPMQGPGGPAAQGPAGRLFRRAGLEGQFREAFDFDPSTKPDEVEGSVAQALLLMNNPVINARIRAEGNNLLGRILKAYPDDTDAIRMVYLRTLARKPTAHEMETCRKFVAQVGKRSEAYEDILWSLLNSAEFQTKR